MTRHVWTGELSDDTEIMVEEFVADDQQRSLTFALRRNDGLRVWGPPRPLKLRTEQISDSDPFYGLQAEYDRCRRDYFFHAPGIADHERR